MSNTPGASDLAAAGASAPAVTTQEVRQAAFATLQRLRADGDYRAAYLRGDPVTHAEVKAAHEATLTPTALKVHGKDAPEDRASMIGSLQKFAYLPDSVVGRLYRGDPCTAELQAWAKDFKGRLFQDGSWTRKYLDGGQLERSMLLELNEILTSPTKK
jgi:hypothetical protein